MDAEDGAAPCDELATARASRTGRESKLANAAFVERAPAHLVEAEREKAASHPAEREAFGSHDRLAEARAKPEARDWLAGLQILGMRLGLERIHALLGALGHPERAAPAVHVVGTNGKSSTARLAAAALAGQGHLAGAYLSPHVADWAERIQIGGAPIDDAALAEAATAVRAAADGPSLAPGDPATQFEALTAMAFWAFRRAGVGAMAIEAGLGGRWDATNVLQPGAAVVLTNIALEHTEFLGTPRRRSPGRSWRCARTGPGGWPSAP